MANICFIKHSDSLWQTSFFLKHSDSVWQFFFNTVIFILAVNLFSEKIWKFCYLSKTNCNIEEKLVSGSFKWFCTYKQLLLVLCSIEYKFWPSLTDTGKFQRRTEFFLGFSARQGTQLFLRYNKVSETFDDSVIACWPINQFPSMLRGHPRERI